MLLYLSNTIVSTSKILYKKEVSKCKRKEQNGGFRAKAFAL